MLEIVVQERIYGSVPSVEDGDGGNMANLVKIFPFNSIFNSELVFERPVHSAYIKFREAGDIS